jgi:hypothetical protein
LGQLAGGQRKVEVDPGSGRRHLSPVAVVAMRVEFETAFVSLAPATSRHYVV